eukprot:2947766-Rhodomonas_salina.1
MSVDAPVFPSSCQNNRSSFSPRTLHQTCPSVVHTRTFFSANKMVWCECRGTCKTFANMEASACEQKSVRNQVSAFSISDVHI